MNMKISKLRAPALAGVVKEENAAAAMASIKNCCLAGADMIDLHMSCLENSDVDTLRKIISSTRLPVLALNYNIKCDKSSAGLDEDERIASFLRAAEAGAAGVDIQGYTFDLKSKTDYYGDNLHSFSAACPKEVVTDESVIPKQCELIEKFHAMGTEVLLSCHPAVVLNAEQVVDLALFLEKRSPDVIKIVTLAKDEEDLAESIRAMTYLKREVKTPVAYHATGKAGIPSRILNPLLGGHIAFCVERYDESSDLNQIDLRTARAAVDNAFKLY